MEKEGKKGVTGEKTVSSIAGLPRASPAKIEDAV
jgi:hypothetical protein